MNSEVIGASFFVAKRTIHLVKAGGHDNQANRRRQSKPRDFGDVLSGLADKVAAHVAFGGIEHGFDKRGALFGLQHNGSVPLQGSRELVDNGAIEHQVVLRRAHEAVVERLAGDHRVRHQFRIGIRAHPRGRIARSDTDRRCTRAVGGADHAQPAKWRGRTPHRGGA